MNRIMTIGDLRVLKNVRHDIALFLRLVGDVDSHEPVILTDSSVGFYDLATDSIKPPESKHDELDGKPEQER
jgi:hypothetical protein